MSVSPETSPSKCRPKRRTSAAPRYTGSFDGESSCLSLQDDYLPAPEMQKDFGNWHTADLSNGSSLASLVSDSGRSVGTSVASVDDLGDLEARDRDSRLPPAVPSRDHLQGSRGCPPLKASPRAMSPGDDPRLYSAAGLLPGEEHGDAAVMAQAVRAALAELQEDMSQSMLENLSQSVQREIQGFLASSVMQQLRRDLQTSLPDALAQHLRNDLRNFVSDALRQQLTRDAQRLLSEDLATRVSEDLREYLAKDVREYFSRFGSDMRRLLPEVVTQPLRTELEDLLAKGGASGGGSGAGAGAGGGAGGPAATPLLTEALVKQLRDNAEGLRLVPKQVCAEVKKALSKALTQHLEVRAEVENALSKEPIADRCKIGSRRRSHTERVEGCASGQATAGANIGSKRLTSPPLLTAPSSDPRDDQAAAIERFTLTVPGSPRNPAESPCSPLNPLHEPVSPRRFGRLSSRKRRSNKVDQAMELLRLPIPGVMGKPRRKSMLSAAEGGDQEGWNLEGNHSPRPRKVDGGSPCNFNSSGTGLGRGAQERCYEPRELEIKLMLNSATDGMMGCTSGMDTEEVVRKTSATQRSAQPRKIVSAGNVALSLRVRPDQKAMEEKAVPFWVRFPKTDLFEQITAVALVLDMVVVGWQVNAEAASTERYASFGFFIALESIFAAFFTVECVLRQHAYGLKEFYQGHMWRWNAFDSVVVFIAWVSLILELSLAAGNILENVESLGLLRMLRLGRLTRAVRFVNLIPELKMMAYLISASMTCFLWALLLLMLMVYCVAVYFTEVISGMVRTNVVTKEEADCWGSIWVSILSLFMSITGGDDWQVFLSPLAKEGGLLGFCNTLLFAMYVAFTTLVTLNLVAGVFVEGAQRLISSDQDAEFVRHTQSLFGITDWDGNMEISWLEFQQLLDTSEMTDYFSACDFNRKGAVGLFRMLDIDKSGTLSVEEFVMGCLRLRGWARTVDLVHLTIVIVEAERLREEQTQVLSSQVTNVSADMERISAMVEALCMRSSLKIPPAPPPRQPVILPLTSLPSTAKDESRDEVPPVAVSAARRFSSPLGTATPLVRVSATE